MALTSDEAARAAAIVGGWFWQMAEGHNYRFAHAVRSMTLFYESAPLEADVLRLVVEYLRGRADVREVVVNHKRVALDGAWATKDAWYQTAVGERWAGTESARVRLYWVLVRAGSGAGDGPYVVEDGCQWKVSHAFHWDVEALPDLPASASGVQYALQGVVRDRETGFFSCVVERRERVRQDVALYTTAVTAFETRREEQHLGVRQAGVAAAGRAAGAANGVLTERRVTKNADCTSDVHNAVTTETPVRGAVKAWRRTRRGTVASETDRSQAAPLTGAGLAVGETRRSEKTPGGLWHNTVETTAGEAAGTVAAGCERTALSHTDSETRNVAGRPVTERGAAEPNVSRSAQARLTDEGTWDVTEQTTTHLPKTANAGAAGGGWTEAVETGVNQEAADGAGDGGANTEASVSVAVNDHGSLSVTKHVRRHLRKSAAAVTDFATETRRTVTTVNAEGDAPTGGTNVVRSATPNGRGGTTIQETTVTPKPVDSGWKTWTSTQRTATGTFRYRHGIRVFKNLKDCPTPPATHNAAMSVGINQYGLYDGQMSYVDFVGFTASGGSSHVFGGYATDTKKVTDSNGDKWDANVIAYYGAGNEGAEAQDRAKGILLPGVHLGNRCYIRSVTKAGGTK